MLSDPQTGIVVPLSAKDKITLKKLKDQAYFTLARTYGPFFLALAILCYKIIPGSTFRGQRMDKHMTRAEYILLFWIVFILFGAIFFLFLIRDYRRRVIPLEKERKNAKKYCISFVARKYKDPLYNKCLLFYPIRVNDQEKKFQGVLNEVGLCRKGGE